MEDGGLIFEGEEFKPYPTAKDYVNILGHRHNSSSNHRLYDNKRILAGIYDDTRNVYSTSWPTTLNRLNYFEEFNTRSLLYPRRRNFSQLDELRAEVQRRDQELMAMAAKMKTLEDQHQDYQRHIAVLKESLMAKEEHYNMLQADVSLLFFSFYISISIDNLAFL